MSPQDNLFDLIDNAPAEDNDSAAKTNAPEEYSVSEISHKLKQTVENTFSYVRVRGELSRVTVAKSGHVYTSLKDADACLDAICWRGTAGSLSVTPEEGLDVVVTGRLTTYPGRSNYQIIIETMELAGEGALLKMLEDRRKKLAAEGLFDDTRKKPIPFLPNVVGVITSPTGAVIRDIMHRLNDRFPRPVYLWPAMVQGDQAAKQVIEGIKGFNELPETSPYRPDVLIVARGGGSLEDLMPFNDEALVRAIAASQIPIISAVGHETDTTLADYVADLRAPTPTGAAEKAVPVRRDLITAIKQIDMRLTQGIQRLIRENINRLSGLARGLVHPKTQLENKAQKLDGLAGRLDAALRHTISNERQKLTNSTARLSLRGYVQKLKHQSDTLGLLHKRMHQNANRITHDARKSLSSLSSMLETLSFERTLERGYAIIKDDAGHLVTQSQNLSQGQNVSVHMKDGKRSAQIKD